MATLLIKQDILRMMADGSVDLAFRRWTKPTVKAGGTLVTSIGTLAITSVEIVRMDSIRADEARRAGLPSKKALLDQLRKRPRGKVYRVELRLAGEDPRIALRNDAELSDDDVGAIAARLMRFDAASQRGAWTDETLALIASNEGTRAPELAERFGQDTKWFKTNVRKLKELGLTESLKVGYRLSPRGRAFIAKARD